MGASASYARAHSHGGSELCRETVTQEDGVACGTGTNSGGVPALSKKHSKDAKILVLIQ